MGIRARSLGLAAGWLLVHAAVAAAAAAADGIAPLRRNLYPPVNVDGRLGEWRDHPTSVELPAAGRAGRPTKLWLATWSRGLTLAGRVHAAEARFEGSAESLHAGDHVVLRIALVDALDLPPIGFGSHHGEVRFASEDDCADPPSRSFPLAGPAIRHHCRSWVAGQRRHRERLARLYQRRWILGPALGASDPGLVLEDVASPAFAGLDLHAREQLAALRPAGRPRMAVHADPDDPGAYGFEILVPWNALPPADALDLARLHLSLEVHAGHAGGEPEPPPLPAARPEAWTAWRLEVPRRHRLGACGAPLRGLDPYRRWRPAHYRPAGEAAGGRLDEAFVIANDAAGYRDAPQGASPIIHVTRFFAAALGEGEAVCGPGLALLRGGERFAIALPGPGPGDPEMGSWIPEELEARREGDRWLVKLGPRVASASWFGTGQCGACPRATLRILAIDPAGAVETWLDVDRVIDLSSLVDLDLHLSEDWRRLDHYERVPDEGDGALRWLRTSRCREEAGFEPCGAAERRAPPHRVLPPLEGG